MILASLAVPRASVIVEWLVTNAINLMQVRCFQDSHFNRESFPACLPIQQKLWSLGLVLESNAKLP